MSKFKGTTVRGSQPKGGPLKRGGETKSISHKPTTKMPGSAGNHITRAPRPSGVRAKPLSKGPIQRSGGS